MATVFKRNGKGPWIIQYFDASGRRRERSARTTDYRSAERIAAKLEADVALERAGVADARQARFASENRRPLSEHLEVYLQQLRDAGRAAHTMGDKRNVLPLVFKEIGATRSPLKNPAGSARLRRPSGSAAEVCTADLDFAAATLRRIAAYPSLVVAVFLRRYGWVSFRDLRCRSRIRCDFVHRTGTYPSLLAAGLLARARSDAEFFNGLLVSCP